MTPSPDSNWITVYTDRGTRLGLVEEALQSAGVTVVRTPEEGLADYSLPVGVLGTTTHQFFNLKVPADQYEAQRDAIDAAITAARGAENEDAAAEAEAEEDYDVRGCPQCRLYFHDTFASCPGCGAELVPAVECFDVDQLEPEHVIVASGTPDTLQPAATRLQTAGFGAQLHTPARWSVAVLQLPWHELTTRTNEAEGLVRG